MSLTVKGVKPQVIRVDENGTITDITEVRVVKNGVTE